MAPDREQIERLARSYTEAWCSRDPTRVAGHYVPGGMIAINGGAAAGIGDVAEAFIAAFPDIEVLMDDLVLREDGIVEYRWTFTGTSAETGKTVRVPGFEEWTIAPDGLIAESRGHYDQAEYDRQLQHGIGPAPASVFDPAAYKQSTREQWQETAEAWHRWGPTLERWLGPATELMLDCAGVGPGARVLDLAAGAGGQSIAAAKRVGPSGSVLATDISPAILDFAAAAARDAGLANLEVRELDGEALDELDAGGFDAVISRVGLIYFPDQRRALQGIRHVLRPGGRVSAIVYSTAERNPFFSIPVAIVRRIAGLPAPAPGTPGPFSLGGPNVLEAAYEDAGFADVRVDALDAPLRFPTAAECVEFERESFGALHAMLAGVGPAERERAWREIETELRSFERSDGFEGPCELLVGSASRPAGV